MEPNESNRANAIPALQLPDLIMPTALLVSGSPEGVSTTLLTKLASMADFILAVDSGAEQLARAGLTPDLLIGDFDSLSQGTLAQYKEQGVQVQAHDAYKNATDLELGIETLLSLGYKNLIATNVLGGRTDHNLGSIGALANAAQTQSARVVLQDEHEICYFVASNAENKVLELSFDDSSSMQKPKHISIISWGGSTTVSIKGTEWPLDHHELSPNSALGVSNIVNSHNLRFEVHDGSGTALLLLTYVS